MAPDDPARVGYPPAPWRSRGQLWCGLLSTTQPQRAPLRPVLNPRTLVAVVIRYQHGTLRYDEFVLASLVRRGARAGLWVQHIWVDSVASLWGGREIWGLPKQLAEFTWSANGVRIANDTGPLATLALAPRTRQGPTLPLRLGGFAHLGADLLWSPVAARGRLRPASVAVTDWSDRLPALAHGTARFGLVAAPLRITAKAPQRTPLRTEQVNR